MTLSLRALLRRWLSGGVRLTRRRSPVPSCRPTLQALEDRTLPSTFTWTGADVAGGNANWSDPNNWTGGVAPARAGQAPAPNTNLVFPTLPSTPGTKTTVDDLAAGSRISSITFSGVGYDITAAPGQSNSLSVAAINDKGNGGGNGLDSSLTLLLPPGVPTVVQVTNTRETFVIDANVSDASGLVPGELVKTGGGTAELHGADSSAGPTLINQGLLATASDLGSGTITVAPGATLGILAAGFAVGETQNLILGGTLYFGGEERPLFPGPGRSSCRVRPRRLT